MGLIADLFAIVNRVRYGRIQPVEGSLYDFRMRALSGEEIDFRQFRGKKILIVNTASRCVFTPQLEELQQLHEKYQKTVHVLGFPSNDFFWQEPGTSSEIEAFCQKNYGVTFQMFDKISVIGGDSHPLYKWLAFKSGKIPTWNFCKYLVDENGDNVLFFNSKVNPLDKHLTDKIVEQH